MSSSCVCCSGDDWSQVLGKDVEHTCTQGVKSCSAQGEACGLLRVSGISGVSVGLMVPCSSHPYVCPQCPENAAGLGLCGALWDSGALHSCSAAAFCTHTQQQASVLCRWAQRDDVQLP